MFFILLRLSGTTSVFDVKFGRFDPSCRKATARITAVEEIDAHIVGDMDGTERQEKIVHRHTSFVLTEKHGIESGGQIIS